MQKNGKGVATVTVGEASNNPLSAKHHPDKKKTGVENMETETMNRMSTDQSKSHLEVFFFLVYNNIFLILILLSTQFFEIIQ